MNDSDVNLAIVKLEIENKIAQCREEENLIRDDLGRALSTQEYQDRKNEALVLTDELERKLIEIREHIERYEHELEELSLSRSQGMER